MEPLEVVATIVVMLLALYGCACAIRETVVFMVKPRENRLRLELMLDETVEGVEQQLRYATAIVHHFGWRLHIEDKGMTAEQRDVVTRYVGKDNETVSKI